MRAFHGVLLVAFGVVLGLGLGATPACAFGRHQITPDAGADPILSGDVTAIVEGCGAQPIVGFTFCRVVAGDAAAQNIDFIGPPAQCADATCVFVKVYDQAGQLAWGGSLPKGQTRVSVPWSTLIGSGQFQALHRGIWGWDLEVHWVDPDNHPRVSVTQGEIRLVVYEKGYTPLDKVSADPNFVWSWRDGAKIYKMASSLRAYVGDHP